MDNPATLPAARSETVLAETVVAEPVLAHSAHETSMPLGNTKRTAKRSTRELIYAVICLLLGFIVLPVSIYTVGTLLLGPYAGGKSMAGFFAEFYRNLGHGTVRTWFIALGPYLALWLVRLSFRRWGPAPPAEPPQNSAPAQDESDTVRREPFISG